jgi:hypothetical protein
MNDKMLIIDVKKKTCKGNVAVLLMGVRRSRAKGGCRPQGKQKEIKKTVIYVFSNTLLMFHAKFDAIRLSVPNKTTHTISLTKMLKN